MNLQNSDELLQFLIASGKLSESEVAISEDYMKKDQVAKRHNHEIYYTSGRWCTCIDNKAYKKGLQQITDTTEERLIEKLYNHYFNAVTLCFTIRVGELKGLQWDDVDMDRREIYIHQQLNSEDKLDEIKKQRETGHRRLAMPDIAYDVLNTVEPHLRSGFVFTNNDAPLTTDGFNDTLKRRCDAVGIRYLSSHKIRFANCVLMLENGVPLYEAQKAMGHANQAMTEHYNRVLQKRANQDIKLVFNDALNNVRNVSAS